MDQTSPWGMVVHSPQQWDINELASGGVAWIRLDIPWHLVQRDVNGSFDFAYYDNVVNWATSRGMWILGGLGSTPAWAIDQTRYQADTRWLKYRPHAYPPKNLLLWDEYVKQVVGRYATRVTHWGIWNEPDSYEEPPNVCFWRGTQQEFFNDIMKRALDVIPAGHRICAADLAKAVGATPPWRANWVRDILQTFGRRLHALTVHIYRGAGDGSDVIDRASGPRGLIDNYNSQNGTRIELWITETGWHTEHSETTISDRIKDLCNEVRRNPWVKKIFPYVWSDNYSDPFNFKRAPNTPRQQWAGYKAGIRGA